jgi:mRNA interferase MazF
LIQGDIAIVFLDPTKGHEQSKTRPCVIVQCNVLNKYLGTTIVIPITSKKFEKSYPNVIKITSDCLNKSSCVKLEQVRCIDKSRISRIIGKVSLKGLAEIKKGLEIIFET